MNEHNTVEGAPESIQRSGVKILILNRIIVMCFMVYLAVMVSVAYHGLFGNLFDGFFWPTSGWSLFPIPLNPHWFIGMVLPVHIPLTTLELLVYLIFIGPGVWVFWEIIGIFYIMYPWSPFLQSVIKRGRTAIAALIGRGSCLTTI